MLQLPTTKAPARPSHIKRGAMKGFPDVRPFNCPVMALAAEYEKLVSKLGQADVAGADPDKLARIHRKMERISRKASWISPDSYAGAVFQMMLVTTLTDVVRNGATEKIKIEASAHLRRLVFRSLDWLDRNDNASLPLTKRELIPSAIGVNVVEAR